MNIKCPSTSPQQPVLTSCSQATENCLTVVNYTNEPILLQGGSPSSGGTYCNIIQQGSSAPDPTTSYFNSATGDCWSATGQNTGNTYVQGFCTYGNVEMDVTSAPSTFPSYPCKNIPWGWLTVGWLVATAGLSLYRSRYNKKIISKNCLDNFGPEICNQGGIGLPDTKGTMGTGIILLMGIVTILLALGWAASKGYLGTSVTCGQCQNRGPDWTWTDQPFYPTQSYVGPLCRTLGFCQCRSAIQEKNCQIYGQKNNVQNNIQFTYNYEQSMQPSNYDCSCVNTYNTSDRVNCLVQNSTTGQSCTSCGTNN